MERVTNSAARPARLASDRASSRAFERGIRSSFGKLCLLVALLIPLSACDNATPQERVTKAHSLKESGEINAAVIELKNAIKGDPSYPDARLALGELYLVTGDYPSALKELERAVDLGSLDPAARLGLLRAKLGLGRVQEVIGDLAAASERTIDEDLLLAESYLSVGDSLQAKPLFERGKDRPAGMAGLAAIAWNEGKLDLAAQYFAQATDADPTNPQYWLRRAELELSRSQYAEAKTSFAQAAQQPTGRVLGEVGEVRTLLAEKDLEGAAVAIDDVLAIAPNYPLARYLEGLIRYQTGDLDSAESALREVQRQFPSHGPSLYLMGLVKYQQKQLPQAEENLSRFLSVDEDSESGRKLLAAVQYERGEPAKVVETLEAVEGASRDPQLMAMMGTALMQLGRTGEATGYLERAVELAPDGAAFRNQLALSLLSAGEDERAVAELDTAIATDGEQFQSDYLLAMIQMQQGDLEKATASVAQILSKSPESPVGHNLQGAIEISQDKPEAAIASFRKALELDPSFGPARNNLTRLLERRGDVPGAQQVFLDRIKSTPDDESALLSLADLLARNGRQADAVEYAQRATLVNADNAQARLALARLYVLNGDSKKALATIDDGLRRNAEDADLKLLRSELNMRLGNTEEAQRDLNELQAMLVDRPDNARLAFVVGRLHAQLGDLDMARTNFENVLNLTDGQSAEALLALGRLNMGQRKYKAVAKQIAALKKLQRPEIKGAAKLLEADMEVAQGNQSAAKALYRELHEMGQREGTLRLAGIALRDKDADEGIELLQAWLKTNPADQAARILLSSALLADDKSEQAISEYEKLMSTGNPVVLNNLAWLYMEREDPRALKVAERAYTAAPDNADIADTYGWILVQNDQAKKAVEILGKSVDARDDNPTALYHLGFARYRLGELPEARRLLKKALSFDGFPERSEAQSLLETIGS